MRKISFEKFTKTRDLVAVFTTKDREKIVLYHDDDTLYATMRIQGIVGLSDDAVISRIDKQIIKGDNLYRSLEGCIGRITWSKN